MLLGDYQSHSEASGTIQGAPTLPSRAQYVFLPFISVVYITHQWQPKNCLLSSSYLFPYLSFPINVPTLTSFALKRIVIYSLGGCCGCWPATVPQRELFLLSSVSVKSEASSACSRPPCVRNMVQKLLNRGSLRFLLALIFYFIYGYTYICIF